MTLLAAALLVLFLAVWLIAERRRPLTEYDRRMDAVDRELDELLSAERAKELFDRNGQTTQRD